MSGFIHIFTCRPVPVRLTDDEVRPGVLSTTFHFPELQINVVTSSESDKDALYPEYKVVAVRIRKSKVGV